MSKPDYCPRCGCDREFKHERDGSQMCWCDAEQMYEHIMRELLDKRASGPLGQKTEASYASMLSSYWTEMTDEEQAEMEKKFSMVSQPVAILIAWFATSVEDDSATVDAEAMLREQFPTATNVEIEDACKHIRKLEQQK